jgi:hypothetical protein
MNIEELRKQYLTEVDGSSYLDYTGVKSEQYVQWLEQHLVKLFAISVVMPSTLPEPQQWFMDKFDVTASRMNLIEHKGNDVVRFIHEYLDDLP